MKKFLTSIAVFSMMLALAPLGLMASHITGMDLTYAYTGTPGDFKVTLKFYRDCAGIPPPTGSLSICVSSLSCGQNFNGTLLEIIPPGGVAGGNPIPIPPCIPNPGATTCTGGTAYGITESIFEGIITLPTPCTDWVFSYTDCCRNALITTLAVNGGIYIATSCDNLNYPTNSSPTFSNYPVTQFCVNNQFYYDQGASDVDGDSLAYFLVAPLDGNGCPGTFFDVTYAPGYSDTVPFDSQNGITMDNLTGIVSFIPSVQQVGVMAVLVREYRAGIEIGQIRRDIQINITAQCAVLPPVLATFNVTLGGANLNGVGVQCGDSAVILSFSANPVQCKSIEQFGTDFRILAPNGQPNPAISATAINCQGGVTDSILVHFYYPLKYGITYLWTKVGTDNNTLLSECGSAMAEYDTIKIILDDTSTYSILTTQNLPCAFDSVTLTFSEPLDCYSFAANGSDLVLYDATGAQFQLSNVYGVGCNVGNPNSTIFHFDFASVVNGLSPFYLVSLNGTDSTTVANQCGKFVHPGDTIAILTTSNDLPISLGTDTTVCSTEPLPILNAGLTGAATYLWTFNGSPLTNNTQTLQSTGPGTYTVLVTVGPNCEGSDTTQVLVVQAPQLTLTDQTICVTDPLPLLDALNPGATYDWTLNGVTVGNSQTFQTTGPGTYAVTVSAGSCKGTGTMNLTINPAFVPSLIDTAICNGGSVTIDALPPNATDSVFWYLNNTLIATTQTITVNAAGNYIGVVQSSIGCRGNDTATITVFPYIVGPIVDAIICIGSSATLDALPLNTTDSVFWYSNNTLIATTQTLTIDSAGSYIGVIQTSQGCRGGDTATVTVEVPLVAPQVNCGSGTGNLKYLYTWNSIPGATGYQVFVGGQWITNTNNPDTAYASATPEDGFKVKALNSNSACKEGGESELAPCEVIIPNIITPNNDGVNDVFFIKNLEGHPNSSLKIMNRWGNIVLNDSNYQNNWGGDKLSDGTYYYILKLDNGTEYTGTLTILNGK